VRVQGETLMRKFVVGLAGIAMSIAMTSGLGAAQAGQATGQTTTAALSAEFAPKPYTVAAGDKIQLDFYNLEARDMDMKDVYLVALDGNIVLKYVGAVRVHGMTMREIEDAVLKALVPRYYLPNVIQVTALIAEEREQEVTVQGQVNSPGLLKLRGNQMTVNRAITAARGFTSLAGQEVELKRMVDGKRVVINLTRTQLENGEDPQLIAEDEITVKQGQMFFVNGEVNSGGQKAWQPGMTVGRAISLSNGMTAKGKLGHIMRPEKDPATGRVIKYKKIKGLKLETPILPDDELVISRKWFG
jgi:protein involved in polysaccharide export with SLBB domain